MLLFLGSMTCLADYAVSVSATSEKLVEGGDLVTHVFTITNTGTDDDVYTLVLALPDGWTSLPIPSTVSVNAGEEAIIFVNFLVSPIAAAGIYEVSLDVESSFDPAVTAQSVALVQVKTTTGLAVEWVIPPPPGQPGGAVEASFRVGNTGNTADLFRVEASASVDWESELSEEEFELAPGESRVVGLRISIPVTPERTQFVLTVVVSSLIHPALEGSLREVVTLGPPPPELVGGTLFPEWSVSGTFSIDCSGEPRLSFSGSGDIENLGKLDASVALSMDEGLYNAQARLETEAWTVNLGGGGIGSTLLSVAGKPLWSGTVEDWLSWYVLYTAAAKGIFAQYDYELASCRFSLGSDADRDLSFQEIEVEYDFPGPPSGWFTVETGTQTGSGTAIGLGGELDFEGWDLEGSYFSIGPGFPLHTPKEELQVSGSVDECPLPLSFSVAVVQREAGAPPTEYLVTSKNFALSLGLPSDSLLSFSGAVGLGLEDSDDVPQTINTVSWSLSGSISGKTPLSWSLSAGAQRLEDKIADTTVISQRVSMGVGFPVGQLSIDPSLNFRRLKDDSNTTFSSSLTVRASADVFLSPEVTITLGGSDGSLGAGISWEGAGGASFSWSGRISLCGEMTFSTQINLTLMQVFPFCGPSKGRITGIAFVDENANGHRDADETGAAGVLFGAADEQAITGDHGGFVFPPMLPGTYDLDIVTLPAGLTPGISLPLKVDVHRGEAASVWIPLEPRSWLRGRVFVDENRNGVRDGAEPGLAGVRIRVQGQAVDTVVTTDANGRFVAEARYGPLSAILDENSLPERSDLTTPVSAVVTMPMYGAVDVVFGVYQRPRPIVITFGPPTAQFSAIPASPKTGDEVRLVDESMVVEGAELVDWAWEFALGETTFSRTGNEVTVVFPEPGAWRVRLIVTDSDGLKGAVEKIIQVQ